MLAGGAYDAGSNSSRRADAGVDTDVAKEMAGGMLDVHL
jgi:hypothetical protein